jgi:hypothetical protein
VVSTACKLLCAGSIGTNKMTVFLECGLPDRLAWRQCECGDVMIGRNHDVVASVFIDQSDDDGGVIV